MEDIKIEVKKTRKIGRVTFGITMILFGISVFLQMFLSFDIFRYVLMVWPLIFVSLGLEVIYFSNKSNVDAKYDVGGIILIFIVLGLGTIMSFASFGINKILYNEDVKAELVQNLKKENYNYYFDETVSLNNLSEKQIIVKLVENEDFDYTRVHLKLKYDESKTPSFISLLANRTALYDYIYSSTSNLVITQLPDFVESAEITVTTPKKENVTLSGNFKK